MKRAISFLLICSLWMYAQAPQQLLISHKISATSPIALVAHTIGQTLTNITTSAIDTTGASLIVIGLSYLGPGDQTSFISDSKGNTWTGLTSQNASGTDAQLIYTVNPTVGSGHTFTYSGGGGVATIMVAAFSNVKTSSPFDQQNGSNTSGGTIQTGSVTPSENNELLVTVLATNAAGGSAATIDSGFTVSDYSAFLGGTAFGGGMAYLVQTTAGAVNPTWTQTHAAAAAIGTFKHQ